MLQATVIGHLGSDAEVKNVNGREFVAFRIANTDRWTDEAGQTHEETQWVDCTINGKPAVLPYLKRGQQVYVSGSAKSRVYSSAKDRCMKAGLSIAVRSIELLGGKSDDVPRVLYNANDGVQVDVVKYYCAPSLARDNSQPEWLPLVSRTQERYVADRAGWIQPYNDDNQQS